MPKKRREREFALRWRSAALFAGVTRSRDGKRVLLITVAPEMGENNFWRAVAIETSHGDGSLAAADQALADHAHHVLGDYIDFPSALAASESYARAWFEGTLNAPACECGEIAAVAPHA